MPYQEFIDYLDNADDGGFAADVAAYLNDKVANFNDVADYFSPRPDPDPDYFNEATVQGAMFLVLNEWTQGDDENEDHYLIRMEIFYRGGPQNAPYRADIWVTYDNNDDDPRNVVFELKTDFQPESVNADVGKLENNLDQNFNDFDLGYAAYIYDPENDGWCANIDAPMNEDVATIPIPVNIP